MNLETIVNQFETRAGTLLRYYTGLLEHSKVQPCSLSYTMIHLIWHT